MEWKIRPITEEYITKLINEVWSDLTVEEKRYLKQLYLNICVSNDNWQTELDNVQKVVAERQKKVSQEEYEEQEDESADADSYEVDAEDTQPVKLKGKKFKVDKKDVKEV